MASIVVPQRKQESDPLDKLAAAVSIARSIYGIHVDSKNLELAKQKREEESKSANDLRSGVLNSKDLLQYGASDISDAPKAGYMPAYINQPGQDTPLLKYIKPKSGESQIEAYIKGLNLKEKQLDISKKQRELENPSLPDDKKHFTDTLATKNANKASIKNQIDSVVGQWDNLSDDQKVSMGRQLIKTLNSQEGADAVGNEESKRLGAKLEFALGNFTNDNPTQFGRDLEGFKEQAINTSAAIGGAINTNQQLIDQTYGRPQKIAVSNGKETLLIDPADLSAAQKDGYNKVNTNSIAGK